MLAGYILSSAFMYLALSIIPVAKYWTVPFTFRLWRWYVCNSIYYHRFHHIGNTQHYLYCNIFRDCVWYACICIICQFLYYYRFHLYHPVHDVCKGHIFTLRHIISSYYHHYAEFFIASDKICIWNAYQVYSVKCVSKCRPILTIIWFAMYGDMRYQLTHFPIDVRENISTSYYHHQIGDVTHQSSFRARQLNCGMRCMFNCALWCNVFWKLSDFRLKWSVLSLHCLISSSVLSVSKFSKYASCIAACNIIPQMGPKGTVGYALVPQLTLDQ